VCLRADLVPAPERLHWVLVVSKRFGRRQIAAFPIIGERGLGRMVYLNAAVGQHALEIAIADRKP
jgi:hypothetical protein